MLDPVLSLVGRCTKHILIYSCVIALGVVSATMTKAWIITLLLFPGRRLDNHLVVVSGSKVDTSGLLFGPIL